MNLPNLLTLSRIPLMFAIVGLLYVQFPGAPTLAFLLFILSGLTDWWDGLIARRRGLVSNFGIFMDALADKISVVGILVALTDRKMILREPEIIPVLLLLFIVTREFLITGMRLVAASRGVVVAAERGGKQKTVSQILAIGFFLFIPLLEQDINRFTKVDLTPAGDLLRHIGFAFFLLATFFTLRSGVNYFIKYRRVFQEDFK